MREKPFLRIQPGLTVHKIPKAAGFPLVRAKVPPKQEWVKRESLEEEGGYPDGFEAKRGDYWLSIVVGKKGRNLPGGDGEA